MPCLAIQWLKILYFTDGGCRTTARHRAEEGKENGTGTDIREI